MTRRLFQGLCLLAALLAGACTHLEPHPKPGPNPKQGMLAFELALPSPSPIATRANSDGSMSALEENDITHLDVLIFRANNNEFYMRHEIGQGDIKNIDAATGQKKTFYIPVPTEVVGGNVYAVLIANAKASVDAVSLAGRTKQAIMPELTMDVTGIWPVTPTGAFRRFPMWGESEVFDFDASSLETLRVGLLRAVAKIDVGLGYNDATKEFDGLHNFTINRIWLCNSSDMMHIVPENFLSGQQKVETPTLFSSSTFTAASEYKSVAAGTPNYGENSSEKRFVNVIYCAEHAAGTNTGTDYMDNCFLVVEGEYAASGDKTFYRVDFIRTWTEGGNVKQEFLPLLRNHQYRVNITKVAGAGFETFGEATAAKGTNTNLTVVVENSNDKIREIVYNGQYYLGVGSTTIRQDKVERILDFPIETNYHEIVFSTAETWISDETSAGTLTTTDRVNGLGAQTMSIKLEENATGAPRTGTFTLTAGMLDMKQVVTVTQDDNQRITVWYEDIYFAYRDDNGLPGSQYIEVLCPNDDWRIELTDDPASVVKKIWVEDENGTVGDHTGVAGMKYKVFFDFYGQQTTGNNPYTTFDVRIVITNTEDPAVWTHTMEGGLLLYDKVNDNYFQFPPWDNSWIYDDSHWTSSVPPGWKDAGTDDVTWGTAVSYETMRRWLRYNLKPEPQPVTIPSWSMLTNHPGYNAFVQFLLPPKMWLTGSTVTRDISAIRLFQFYKDAQTYPHTLATDNGYGGIVTTSTSGTSYLEYRYETGMRWLITSNPAVNRRILIVSSTSIQPKYYHAYTSSGQFSARNVLGTQVWSYNGPHNGADPYGHTYLFASTCTLTWARRVVKDE